jgi:GNAT superfamily N-acetyltransferase
MERLHQDSGQLIGSCVLQADDVRTENDVDDAMNVRAAEEHEIDQLAQLWFESWRDAHEHVVPPELIRLRTLQSFRDRLQAALPNVRVIGSPGSPVGFYLLKEDELYQLFVSAQARGTGVAAVLVADAEARLAATGVETAWLACAIGNERAARFYEKSGWHRIGTMVNEAETSEGTFLLDVWRYEKSLTR